MCLSTQQLCFGRGEGELEKQLGLQCKRQCCHKGKIKFINIKSDDLEFGEYTKQPEKDQICHKSHVASHLSVTIVNILH